MVKVKDVMRKRVITIGPGMSMEEAARIMTNNRVGSLVIVEGNDRAVDIVTESDMTTIVAKGMNPKLVKVEDLKKEGLKKKTLLISVGPEENILDVAKMMVKNGIKRVPVIEGGVLKGIISDKEILLISPELIEIMSENIKFRVGRVSKPGEKISGICEDCGSYSDELKNINDQWLCPDCREG